MGVGRVAVVALPLGLLPSSPRNGELVSMALITSVEQSQCQQKFGVC